MAENSWKISLLFHEKTEGNNRETFRTFKTVLTKGILADNKQHYT